MTVSIKYLQASDDSGEAVKASVTATRAISATTLVVDSVANFPDFFIGTSGVLNAETGYLDPLTMVVFLGHLDGANIIIDSFAAGYSDIGNAVDDVVLLKPTTKWVDQLVAALLVSLDDDGTLNDAAIAVVKAALEAATDVRFKPRILADDTIATLTPNIDDYNIYELNAQAGALTIANPAGTPNDGDVIIIRIKDNGTARAITYGNAYTNISGLDSLATTVISKWSVLGIVYNATAAKYQIVSISTEA